MTEPSRIVVRDTEIARLAESLIMYILKSALWVQWDAGKERKNIEKHGVGFDEAASIFLDENVVRFYDNAHASTEDRFWIIGLSQNTRILFVVYSLRRSNHDDKETYYRIISARKANKKEKALYRASD